MYAERFRELRHLPDTDGASELPRVIVQCFEDLDSPIFHTLHLASRHTPIRHVSKGSSSRFVPCVWGVRRDDYRSKQPEGPCRLGAFLTTAAAMAGFLLSSSAGRWGRLLPAQRMKDVTGKRSKLYLADFWTLTLHHLVWSKQLPYAIRAHWAEGTSIHDESFYFVSRLPVDAVDASRDALILFQEAAKATAGDPAEASEAVTIEPPIYRDGRWRLAVRPATDAAKQDFTQGASEPDYASREGPESGSDETAALELNDQTFTCRSGEATYRFKPREKQLFALLERISRRPGFRVTFDDLRSVGDVWDGSPVEDSTIRGGVTRLRKVLREHGLVQIADRITTGTYQGTAYVLFK